MSFRNRKLFKFEYFVIRVVFLGLLAVPFGVAGQEVADNVKPASTVNYQNTSKSGQYQAKEDAQDETVGDVVDSRSSDANTPMLQGEDAQRIEALLQQADFPDKAREMSFEEVLEAAGSRNLSVAEARIEIEKANVRIKQAWTPLLPSVQAEMQYVRADHADEVDFGGRSIVVNPANTLTGGITAGMPLVNAGIWKGIQISKTAEELTKLSVEEIKRTVTFGAAKAYYTALMSLSLIDLYKVQIRSTCHHLYVAKQKLKAGSGLKIDVLRASIEMERVERSLVNARLSLASACDALGVLIGENTLVIPKKSEIKTVVSGDEKTMIQQAEKSRLDLAVQQKNIELAKEQIRAAQRVLLPSLNLGWKGTYKFTSTGDMGDSDKSRWYLSLNLTIPLFKYSDYPKIKENRIAQRQAEIKIERMIQDMGQIVRQAYREYQTSLINVESAERQMELAKESMKIAEKAFEVGAGTSLEVTDARRTVLEVELNYVNSMLKTQLALLNLLEAIGEPLL